MSSLLYLTLLFLSTAWCQTRTIWQYQLGPIVVNPYFGSAPSQDRTAQQNAFTLADPIPAADTNWIDCYPGDQWCASASQINTVAHGSRLPGGDCWEHLAFEYFQTYIDVPAGVTVTQFTIQYPGNVVDDAARITMYNSLYPAGQTLSFTFYQQADTVDLSPFLTTGSNRLIITQEDSCCCGNTVFAIIQLNGVTLLPTCTPPAQDPCTFSTWSSVANDCVLSPISGPSCDDGNPCTQNDVCVSGSCVGQPVVCTAPQCNSASCDSATGACVVSPSGTGNGCNDGDACTLSDTCNNGVCAGTPVVCTALDQCHVAGTCSGGVCSNPAATDGTGCEDGNPCTLNDVCTAGACTSGAEKVCTASDQCHVPGVCDTTTGDCSNPNKCDGKLCDDGNACTQLDTCKNGVCVGIRPVICTVESDCQEAGTCNPATGKCSLDNQCDGTSCNDGNACTLTDTCLDGDCIGSNPVVCQPLDQCHVAGVCDPATGACSNPNVADGTACNDGNACTQTDTCQAGVCVGSNPVVCTASDQCHVAGVCDPTSGVCSNPSKANGATCNDGNACTQTDTCQAGTCTGSNPVVCTPSDQCHSAGTCNPASGKCSNPNRPDGTTCDDHDACTQFDVCTNGACSGTQVCCRTHNGRCGTCVTNCQGSHQSVLNLFKLNGGQNDVENGGNCSGGKVCCVPKDQSTCNNGNNSCKIPDGDGDGEDGGDGNEGDGHGGDRD